MFRGDVRFFLHSVTTAKRSAEVTEESALINSPKALRRFQYLPQLDGMRGLAILLVLLGHIWESAKLSLKWAIIVGSLSRLGVLLFFILSGFLITGLLYAERLDTGLIDLPRFYARRALRLFPALFVFLGIMFLSVRLHWIEYVFFAEFLACLFYARNFYGQSMVLGHLWSLSLEEQFYLCYPYLLRVLPLTWIFRVTLAMTCAIAVFRALVIHFNFWHLGERALYMLPYFRFDSLLIGSCLALALANSPGKVERFRSLMQRIPSGLLWVALLFWSAFGQNYKYSLYQSIQLLLAALLLGQVVLGQGRWSQAFFQHPALRFVGKLSYSLYLWQQLFLLARPPSWGTWPTFPIWLLPPMVLAFLSYKFVESPALRLKRRFAYSYDRDPNFSGDHRVYARS
jgi:peptidoglycan/LPS O-acetylase OafA/YrhL